jgi:selenocysteine lyase/cysteine desulfurase
VLRRFHLLAPAPSLAAIADAVEAAMTQRTRLVMVGRMSLTGQILPVRAIAERVHARGAKLLVDGVLALGQLPTDVKAMDCDFYAAGFHKLACGPRATAVFYVRPGLVEALPSLFGSIEEDRERGLLPRWNSPSPRKFETSGAHPTAHFYALGEALDFVSAIGIERIRARFFALTRRWAERARKLPAFRTPVALHPDHCAGLLSWELAGRDSGELAKDLDARFKVLNGLTERYSGFFGIPEDRPRPLLISNVGLFTTPAEVDRLAEAIEAAAAKL